MPWLQSVSQEAVPPTSPVAGLASGSEQKGREPHIMSFVDTNLICYILAQTAWVLYHCTVFTAQTYYAYLWLPCVHPVLHNFTPGPYLQIPAQLFVSEIIHWLCSSSSKFIFLTFTGIPILLDFWPSFHLNFWTGFSIPASRPCLLTMLYAKCGGLLWILPSLCSWFVLGPNSIHGYALFLPIEIPSEDYTFPHPCEEKVYCSKMKAFTSITHDQKNIWGTRS